MLVHNNQRFMVRLGLIIALLTCWLGSFPVALAQGSPGQWETLYPAIMTSYLNDVFAASSDSIFVVGFNINGAVIGHFDGQVWKGMSSDILTDVLSDPYAELNGIWGSSEENIVAVGGTSNNTGGQQTLILHYNGVEWSISDFRADGCLLDVWGSEAGNFFAVGEKGLMLHWDGQSWAKIAPLTNVDLFSIGGDGAHNVFAVGKDTILHCKDGVWTTTTGLPPAYLFDVWGIPGGDVWAVGSCILRYSQGKWEKISSQSLPLDLWLYKIVGRSGDDIIAIGECGFLQEEWVILRYNGQTWQIEKRYLPGYLNGAWMGKDGQAIVVGGTFCSDFATKGIFLSFDGNSWSMESSEGYEGILSQLWANSDQDVLAVGGHYFPSTADQARVFISHYDGISWSRIDCAYYGFLYDLWGSQDGEFFAAGVEWKRVGIGEDNWDIGKAQVLHSEDGINWESMGINFYDILEDIWGISSNDVYAVGQFGIYHYDGLQWSKMNCPVGEGFRGIWGADASHVFAVADPPVKGDKAIILYYNGTNWSVMDHDICGELLRVWGTYLQDVFAVGENGIYHYDGQTWTTMDCPLTGYFYDLWGNSSDNVWVIGDEGVLQYNGQEWQDTGFSPDPYSPLYGITGTPSGDIFIIKNFDTVLYNKNKSAAKNQEQKIFLREGWNLISFQINVCLYDKDLPSGVELPAGIELRKIDNLKNFFLDNATSPIRDALDTNKAGNWQQITSFGSSGKLLLDKSVPPFVNNLHYLGAGYGYWIKMKAPGYFIITGDKLPPSTSINLRPGWNLIGYLSSDIGYYDTKDLPSCIVSQSPEINFISVVSPVSKSVFSSIDGKYRRVKGFDCSGAKVYDTQVPPFVSNLHYIAPGCGYWIKMTEGANWHL